MLDADGVRGKVVEMIMAGEVAYRIGGFGGLDGLKYAVEGAPADLQSIFDAPASRRNAPQPTPERTPPVVISDAEAERRLDQILSRGVARAEPQPATTPTDPSAELVRACGGEPYVRPVAAIAPTTASDASGDLVWLALSQADSEHDADVDHLFPEPPTAA